MKKIFLSLATLLMASSANVQANNGSLDYKCYLETNLGNEIGFYRWNEKHYLKEVAKLPATKVLTTTGSVYIKEVIECVPLEKDFGRPEAILLDKQTLR
jgi:hypothetical protein